MGPFLIYTGFILLLPLLVSSPKTTVILLDNNQTQNGVVVTTEGGEVELNAPHTQTVLTSQHDRPGTVLNVEESLIREHYGELLEALPLKPVHLQFYFEEGRSELTPESQSQTQALVELIQKREPCIVDIVGHTDREGSDEANYLLGLRRAEMLQEFLRRQQVRIKEVSVQSYGENDLLVPTADGMPEPRNRRVEVIVR